MLQYTNVTDRQTPNVSKDLAYRIASRGKKWTCIRFRWKLYSHALIRDLAM